MFTKKTLARIAIILGVMIVVMGVVATVGIFADTETTTGAAEATTEAVQMAESVDNTVGFKAVASGLAIGLAALGGSIGMGIATSKVAEGISRQPEADGKIRTNFMLGLVFIETAIIYALLVVILIIFVL